MAIHRNTWLRILEFVVAGVLLDLVENTLVFKAATGRTFVLHEVGIAMLIIVPFAVLTELVIDHPRFWHKLFGWAGHKFDHLPIIKELKQ
jgi:hypothetical protein